MEQKAILHSLDNVRVLELFTNCTGIQVRLINLCIINLISYVIRPLFLMAELTEEYIPVVQFIRHLFIHNPGVQFIGTSGLKNSSNNI